MVDKEKREMNRERVHDMVLRFLSFLLPIPTGMPKKEVMIDEAAQFRVL